MKALVTGPTGQVGTVLVETLVKRGNEVHCFVRKSSNVEYLKNLSPDKIHFVQGDLTDGESVFKAISDVQPDYVFHSGAHLPNQHWGSWKHFYGINVMGTKHVAEAVERTSSVKKLAYLSTFGVYGWESRLDVKEDDPYGKKHNFYSKSKLMAERYLWEKWSDGKGIPITMVKPTSVFGPHDRNNITVLYKMIQDGKMVLLDGGKYISSWVYNYDVADLVCKAAESDKATGEDFLVKTGDMTVKEGIDHVKAMFNITGVKTADLPSGLVKVFGAIGSGFGKVFSPNTPPLVNSHVIRLLGRHHTANCDKARDVLGWTPRMSLDEAMNETAKWFIDSGILNTH